MTSVIRSLLGLGLLLATLIALISVGGLALWLAPILIPLQWMAARRSGRWTRVSWTLLAGATAAEAAWLLTYTSFGEADLQLWLFPSLVFVVAISAVWATASPRLAEAAG
jgi:hypothetical protein